MFLLDIRHGLRSLSNNFGFAIVAVLTLGLGIGAATILFSIVDGVLLKPLSYKNPEDLVVVREIIPQIRDRFPTLPSNAMHFRAWRQHSTSFQGMSAIGAIDLHLTGVGEPERVRAGRVSSNLFSMLGVPMLLGRSFLEEEDQQGREGVVVLSDSLWRSKFQADPDIVGSAITLDGIPHEVVGVLSASFRFPSHEQLGPMVQLGSRIDLFRPMAFRDWELRPTGSHNFGVIARLAPDVTLSAAEAELNSLQEAIAGEMPVDMDLEARLIPLQAQVVRSVRLALWVFLAAVGAVLLIVCVNLANLYAAHSARRSHDMAIRAALGAGTGRLIRQLLSESMTLALVGGFLGVLFAYFGVGVVRSALLSDLPRLDEVTLDTRVLLFSFALSGLTGVLFGGLPSWKLARVDPHDSLRVGGQRLTQGPAIVRLRSVLVSVEVALGAVLLITAGLLFTSFIRLTNLEKGFEVEDVLFVELGLPGRSYGEKRQRIDFFDRLLSEVKAIPGLQSVAVTSRLPLQGESQVDLVTPEGDNRPLLERSLANYRFAGGEYFDALGIPVLHGRSFRAEDRDRKVAIVSDQLARQLWPDVDPIGKPFWQDSFDDDPFVVVGVVSDIRGISLISEPASMVYLPYWSESPSQAYLVVRRSGPVAVESAIRSVVWAIDSAIPVPRMQSMEQLLGDSIGQQRLEAMLASGFAVVSLVLASLGIYGVISQSVASRTQEIGIRMALGAARSRILGLIVRQGMVPSLIGMMLGVAGAAMASRVLSSLLFNISPTDLATFAWALALLLAVAFLACLLPALRATRVDPLITLRYE